jgi:hypothetical protein
VNNEYDVSVIQKSWWTEPAKPLGPRCKFRQKVGFGEPISCERSAEEQSRFCFLHQPKPPLKRDAKGRILPRERTIYDEVARE